MAMTQKKWNCLKQIVMIDNSIVDHEKARNKEYREGNYKAVMKTNDTIREFKHQRNDWQAVYERLIETDMEQGPDVS